MQAKDIQLALMKEFEKLKFFLQQNDVNKDNKLLNKEEN